MHPTGKQHYWFFREFVLTIGMVDVGVNKIADDAGLFLALRCLLQEAVVHGTTHARQDVYRLVETELSFGKPCHIVERHLIFMSEQRKEDGRPDGVEHYGIALRHFPQRLKRIDKVEQEIFRPTSRPSITFYIYVCLVILALLVRPFTYMHNIQPLMRIIISTAFPQLFHRSYRVRGYATKRRGNNIDVLYRLHHAALLSSLRIRRHDAA